MSPPITSISTQCCGSRAGCSVFRARCCSCRTTASSSANKQPQPLVTLDGADAGYGERRVLSKVSRSVNPGERIGILGRNGAGKSTLMKLISGAVTPLNYGAGGERVAAPDLIVGNFAQ